MKKFVFLQIALYNFKITAKYFLFLDKKSRDFSSFYKVCYRVQVLITLSYSSVHDTVGEPPNANPASCVPAPAK